MGKKKTSLKDQLAKLEEKWVAFNTERTKVIESGDSIEDLGRKLDLRGIENKDVVLVKILPFDKYYCPHARAN